MDIQPLLAYNTWLSLPIEIRVKLTKLFSIPRTGEVIVRVGTISAAGNIEGQATQDGHSAKDLYAITIEKMQSLLNSTNDNFHRLFAETVDRIDELPLEKPVKLKKDGKKKSKI